MSIVWTTAKRRCLVSQSEKEQFATATGEHLQVFPVFNAMRQCLKMHGGNVA